MEGSQYPLIALFIVYTLFNMKHLFVPYELAKALKELGFDEYCLTYWFNDNVEWLLYPETQPISGLSLKGFKNSFKRIKDSNSVTAPTHQQVVDWFREKYDFHIIILPLKEEDITYYYCYGDTNGLAIALKDSYYEALNAAIDAAIDIVKQN